MTNKNNIISNFEIDEIRLEKAKKIITELQKELEQHTDLNCGPFLAAIYDEKGNLISKCANSVVEKNCSNNHAEMNAIKEAQEKLGTYDLSSFNLSIYVTSEPCIMCAGAIMWSGIKEVYYGVPSDIVEKITGFDEGFKPNWFEEFKKRNIKVCGNIELELGIKELEKYMQNGKKIYCPERQNFS